ncbi:MAG TPA: inositol monophosphatase family protein [Armatimonadota bacterium]|nr:inositol monophosphatase family protein [Armatimonadota bacterium]
MTDYLTVAIEAARQAGQIQREGMHRPVHIREATRHDIKLQTDVDCEQRIRAILTSAFPQHAILGEEGGGDIQPDIPTWIVDPLDGTVNYARRIPHFCTSIALYLHGEPVVGVVYAPVTDELYTAEHGSGAFLNGERIHVSDTARLAEATVAIGFAKSVDTLTSMMNEMADLVPSVQKVRIFGAAALDMAYVSVGRLDGFIEYGLRSWDIAAGTLLIREAGGNVQLTPVGTYCWDVRANNNRIW